MKRKFITNLAFLLLLNGIIKPFWVFGIDRTVQNTVGPESYGLYYALFNLSLIFSILLDIGLTTYNNREIAREPSRLESYFSLLSGTKFMLAFVYAFIVLAAGLLLGYRKADFFILLLLILNQFLASFILYLRSNISGLQQFMTDSALSVLDRLLVILFCGLLLFIPSLHAAFRIEWFILSQTLAYGISLLVALGLVWRKAGSFKPKPDLRFSREIFRKSIPYALLFLLMALYTWTGPVMLKRLLGAEGDLQTGIYAQAFRLLDFLNMYGVLVAGLLLPMFSRMLHRGEPVDQLVKFSFLIIFIPTLVITVSLAAYHNEIMALLYHSHASDSASVFLILLAGFPALSTSYIFGTLLTANGNIRLLNILAGCLGLAGILLNLFLIPQLGAKGAAIACSASLLIAALVQVMLSVNIFRFAVHGKLLLRLLVFTLILFSAAFFSGYVTLPWLMRFGILLAGGMALAFFLRLFSLKEMIRLFSLEEKQA